MSKDPVFLRRIHAVTNEACDRHGIPNSQDVPESLRHYLEEECPYPFTEVVNEVRLTTKESVLLAALVLSFAAIAIFAGIGAWNVLHYWIGA